MFAVIKTGGKQYKVAPGDVIYVEKLQAEPGEEVKFEALLYCDENGAVKVGTPVVDGVDVVAKAIGNVKGKKIVVFKYKAKKNVRKKQGHRQPYTKLEIVSVAGVSAQAKPAAEEKPQEVDEA
ncbi:MAG: 50S ribosomal protein L21 [Christensenellales bacterium]|jgi:large subunit ribosomal protein L21